MSFFLDGEQLEPESLYRIGHDKKVSVTLTDAARQRIVEGRDVIEKILARGDTVYGVNTGFGLFSRVNISEEKLCELQVNLIRSHAAGTGKNLSLERSRMIMALRINVLAKGHSGIRMETVNKYITALNRNCIPAIPCKGTVGASGDLAPLSHLALGMMGEGEMWDPVTGDVDHASAVMKRNGLEPITLYAKEGLALINGTQLITALGCEALVRAQRLARMADAIAAMSLEALKGAVSAFHPLLHKARPHTGQMAVAERLRALLHSEDHPSDIAVSHVNCCKIQDAYTLRCVPQVHGITHDTLDFARRILHTECNSATDNPMIFSAKSVNDPKMLSMDAVMSGGNFHGEYPAKVCDYITIAIHEIGSISERRVERMVNPDLSGLPAFLVEEGGLNSGFMIAHCTAAALVSENRVLCSPSSVESLPTSAAKEDHVSMGGFAARKALEVVENVQTILAIELLCACQALDLLRPLTSTDTLERVHSLVREHVHSWDKDRYMKPDIDKICELLKRDAFWPILEERIEKAKFKH